jgi:hypothetical protein
MKAGSNATFVMRLKLLNMSFSVQAHKPINIIESPVNQNITFDPNIKYLRQQLISELSCRLCWG